MVHALKRRKQRVEYVAAYAGGASKEKLEALEKDLNFEDIIRYRGLAKALGGGGSRKGSGGGSSSGGGSLFGGSGHPPRSPDGRLSTDDDSLQRLTKEIAAEDAANEAAAAADANECPPHYVVARVEVTVPSLSLVLLGAASAPLLKLNLTGMQTEVAVRPKPAGIGVRARVLIELVDLATPWPQMQTCVCAAAPPPRGLAATAAAAAASPPPRRPTCSRLLSRPNRSGAMPPPTSLRPCSHYRFSSTLACWR